MTAFIKHATAGLCTVAAALLMALAFAAMSFPLPWMLGPLVSTATLSFLGLRIAGQRPGLPKGSRNYFVPIIGLMLGSRIQNDVQADLAVWWPSLLVVLPYMIATQLINARILETLGGYDRVTAFFGASPGGLVDAVLIGEQKGGNASLMAVQHVSRVSLSVLTLSVVMNTGWATAGGRGTAPTVHAALTGVDVLVLTLAAVAGASVARMLRFPAANLVGPFLFSAVLHGTGLSTAEIPPLLLHVAQLVVGITLGMGFFGPTKADILKGLGLSVVTVSVGLLLALGLAAITSAFGLAPFLAEFIAFAPGGLAEMGLIALLWNADPVFVTTHHVLRIGLAIIVAPMLFHLVERLRNRDKTGG